MTNGEVWMDGQDRLFANMDRLIGDMSVAAKKGIRKAGMQIIADAQRNMRTAGHNGRTLNNTGRLSQSGRVQDVEGSNDVEIGFFSQSGERGYAAAVEYGSRAHWPPKQEIDSWVYKKLRVAKEMVASVGFLVRRAISRKGTSPHPFFGPAVEKNKSGIRDAITDAINEVTSKDRK